MLTAACSVAAAPEIELADLSDVSATHAPADRILERHPRIHALVNNAGGVLWDRRASADGVEVTFATNVLGGFILAHRLLPALVRTAPGAPRPRHVGGHLYPAPRRRRPARSRGRAVPRRDPVRAHQARTGGAVDALGRAARRPRGDLELRPPGAHGDAGHGAERPALSPLPFAGPARSRQGADTAVWLAASPAVRERTGGAGLRSRGAPGARGPLDAPAPRSEAERLEGQLRRARSTIPRGQR